MIDYIMSLSIVILGVPDRHPADHALRKTALIGVAVVAGKCFPLTLG
jgi:hypothetical protein